jgi:hypothetical protein
VRDLVRRTMHDNHDKAFSPRGSIPINSSNGSIPPAEAPMATMSCRAFHGNALQLLAHLPWNGRLPIDLYRRRGGAGVASLAGG